MAAVIAASGDERSGLARVAAQVAANDTFAARIAALSEPGGFFDTDNLISNERSYLHVVPDLVRRGVQGGAYIGVGPDQNFSYIAHIRPSIALMVDIRRDNLLLHLLFKALFELSPTRADYLAWLTGRPMPSATAASRPQPVEAVVAGIDAARPMSGAEMASRHERVRRVITSYGVPLSAADVATITRFHQRFIDEGLSLQFNSTGRAPQPGYPTYRDLLLERDGDGVRRSFLVSEETYRVVRQLQASGRVIPVVGNLAGPTALSAIGRFLEARKESLSAFYASNVEFYLFRDGSFPRFIANLAKLPRAPHAVIIRSVFGGSGTPLPGYLSASILQPVQQLLDGYGRGEFRQYRELTIAR